ncbi:nodulin MtN21 /EamA-like transporter family protein [Prunus dulcis]|uniref:Nodulin MtN21 /EamA-like transporter family protein n=1 Tax=Prunus dulcis TaxID=3755 RepID=A0A4Y1RJT3_PRUDU|nr:nodulin MtN21 /EamA-like transporter family protein [Prunus dulcis]
MRYKLIALLVLQLCFAGFHIVSRVALNMGVSKVVYPVYRNLIALLSLGPFAYLLAFNKKWNGSLQTKDFSFWGCIMRLQLLHMQCKTLYIFRALFFIFFSFFCTPLPLFLFLVEERVLLLSSLSISDLSILTSQGKMGWLKLWNHCKSRGATIITLHKGLPLLNQTEPIQGRTPLTEEMSSSTDMQNWKWGCIYLLGHCVAWASWMVFQYPAKLTLTSFTCFFGLIQFLVIAVFVETEFENWKIQSGEEFGPVIVAVFQPLQTTLVAVMATLVLGDQLYSGGIIGALLIMLGLYSV